MEAAEQEQEYGALNTAFGYYPLIVRRAIVERLDIAIVGKWLLVSVQIIVVVDVIWLSHVVSVVDAPEGESDMDLDLLAESDSDNESVHGGSAHSVGAYEEGGQSAASRSNTVALASGEGTQQFCNSSVSVDDFSCRVQIKWH